LAARALARGLLIRQGMTAAAAAATATATPAPAPPLIGRGAWHNASGFSFHDILDIINPLQHLPIIASVYRWLTGDRPGAVAQVAGDALYGGPIGAAVGFVTTAMEDSQGRDLGERVLTAVFGPEAKTTAVASAVPPASATTASAAPAAPAVVASALPGAATVAPPHLDHAPIPLFGGIAQPPPATASLPQTPAQQLLAQTTGAIRPAPGAPAQRASGYQPTALVPLVLPAGALPTGAAAAATPTVPTAAAPNPQNPVDISQKMMDALDKYMKLERDRESAGAKSNAPALDLAL